MATCASQMSLDYLMLPVACTHLLAEEGAATSNRQALRIAGVFVDRVVFTPIDWHTDRSKVPHDKQRRFTHTV